MLIFKCCHKKEKRKKKGNFVEAGVHPSQTLRTQSSLSLSLTKAVKKRKKEKKEKRKKEGNKQNGVSHPPHPVPFPNAFWPDQTRPTTERLPCVALPSPQLRVANSTSTSAYFPFLFPSLISFDPLRSSWINPTTRLLISINPVYNPMTGMLRSQTSPFWGILLWLRT